MKYVKHNCKDCNKYLGYKINNLKDKRCSSCRKKFISANPHEHPSIGKEHKDRSMFRKNTFSNVNYDDRIEQFSPSGNSRKKYRMTCIECEDDRGYQRQVDALRLCK